MPVTLSSLFTSPVLQTTEMGGVRTMLLSALSIAAVVLLCLPPTVSAEETTTKQATILINSTESVYVLPGAIPGIALCFAGMHVITLRSRLRWNSVEGKKERERESVFESRLSSSISRLR